MSLNLSDRNSMYEFVVREGNGIKGLVDMGLSKVPDPYVQPKQAITENQKKPIKFDYPPIDMSKLDGPNHDQVVEQIVWAARTLGFFQVVNHGMSLELLESLKVAAHKFHGLPPEKKAAYLPNSSPSPVVKYMTSFVPEKEKAWEWKDTIVMAYTNDDDALSYWPEHCKYSVLEYSKLSFNVAKRLLRVLINNLGATLDDSKLEELIGTKSVIMNFYPPCPNPELAAGLGRHSDLSILTILLQDDISGLYVKVDEDTIDGKKKGDWMEIPPTPGALVINAGDFLEVLSNGRYKSAEHRVGTTKLGARVSIPCFLAPKPTQKIGPLLEAVGEDVVPHFREFTCGDYIRNYFSIPHEGKKPLDFARIN